MPVERVSTGVFGLDALLQGGFPKNYTIMVSGAPGTGKTIFSMQFLYDGAKKGEKCLYIVFEQNVEDLIVQSELFGWDLRPLINAGKLKLVSMSVENAHLDDVINEIKRGGYKRAVVDSLSAILLHPVAWKEMDVPYILSGSLEEMIPDPKNPMIASRILLNRILSEIKKLDCTTIIISELTEGSKGLSRDTISEFLVDGIITMHYTSTGSLPGRHIMIRKMRATKHSEMIHPIEFADGRGISVMVP
jgi:KaiC/GvpD/RAD55 family RecA-like ATPase